MESELKTKQRRRKKRLLRNRKRLRGDAERPRLCVVKSNQNVHVQAIDDESGHTLASISTLSKQFRGSDTAKKNAASAKALGNAIATSLKEKNINKATFDRGSSPYHGILAAVADGAREGGLEL